MEFEVEEKQKEKPSLDNAVTSYLDDNLLSPGFGGKVLTAHRVLGSNSEEVYVWVYAQEFYDDFREKGTGLSGPVVLTISSQDEEEIKIIDHRLPRDGSYYPQDIKAMFPKKVQEAIFSVQQGQLIQELSSQVEERARVTRMSFGIQDPESTGAIPSIDNKASTADGEASKRIDLLKR
jgi:hypothetical protein